MRITEARHRSFTNLLLLIALVLLGSTPVISGARNKAQGKVIVVGILPFQDESETNAPPELGRKLAAQLRQRISTNVQDILPRSINADSPVNVEQVKALGKQQGVQYVIRGGILSLTADEQITAQVYLEIITVETGETSVIRSEGSGGPGAIEWSTIDLNKTSYSSSPVGKALTSAIDSLVMQLHQALSAPVDSTSSEATSETPTSSIDTATAETDEELQQLIAQAEEVVSSGSGDESTLTSVREGLRKLKTALTTKASAIEGGGDPTAADQEIASAKSELQSVLSTLAEQAQVSSGSESVEGEATSGEKRSLLGMIDKYAGEAIGILQKIQEMRSAYRGATAEAAVEGEQVEVSEATEDVSGVVLEMGQPLAGVEVVDKETEVKAITGPDGSYTLIGLPAGKLTTLVIKKDGKQLAMGQVNVLNGRMAVADFDVKKKAVRVIPSTVVVNNRSKTAKGTLKGTARDNSGKALPRALVTIPGVAVARTDSQGRYLFVGLPVGNHTLTIAKAGMKPQTTKVSVRPNSATQTQTQLASDPQSVRTRQQAIMRGSGTILRGKVLSADKQPLAGAKVTLLQSTGAVAVLTSKQGEYQLKDLPPGSYTALVSKVGYENLKRTVNAQAGKTESQNFQLKRKDSPYEARLINTRVGPSRTSSASSKSDSARTSFSGRVIDASTRRPIAGATVSTRGRREKTGENGAFQMTGLAPGNYEVSVTSAGYSEAEKKITLLAGSAFRQEFVMTKANTGSVPSRTSVIPSRTSATTGQGADVQVRLGQVRGRVTDAASGAPIAGAMVAVVGRPTVMTGRDGGFNVASVPAGSYQVIIRKPGFADRRGEIRVRAGETSAASFSLTSTARRPPVRR
jgi:protocatechuate 3,4-dioxygenase beta subunit/TolB-like protein